MIDTQLHSRLETVVLETYLTAQNVFKKTFELPKISYKDMGRTAGRAFCLSNEIHFSPTLFKENVETFLARTVPHEIAHLITYKLYPHTMMGIYRRSPHGREWRFVMQQLGVKDISRCHTYDVSSVSRSHTRTKWRYACLCKEHLVSSTIHNRVQRGASYMCNKCKSKIYLKIR